MGEESQLDEMRTAIRGDFERLAERRGEQQLLRVPEPPVVDAVAPPEEAPEVEPEASRRSWLARLFVP